MTESILRIHLPWYYYHIVVLSEAKEGYLQHANLLRYIWDMGSKQSYTDT